MTSKKKETSRKGGRPKKVSVKNKLSKEETQEEKIKRIEEEIREIERKEVELLEKEKGYIQTHRTEYFKPFPHQQKILELIYQGKKVIVLHGGNQCGKTTLGVNIMGGWALGIQSWDKKPSVLGPPPVKLRLCCADWEHHAGEVIVPALKEWLPYESYTTSKNNVGVEAFWNFKNGSTIELLTHTQETKIQEGWVGHGVWADEILPREKYTANKRGLVKNRGIFLITLTEVREGWILDDLLLSNDPEIGYVTDIPMSANPLLTPEAIAAFERSCTEEEKEARVYGKMVRLVGRICKQFNPDLHVIQPFEIKHDWPIIAMIDIHPSKEQAIGFYAADERDFNYVIDEIWEHLSPEEIADRIIKRKQKNNWRLNDCFIDPLAKGDDAYMRNRADVLDSYTIIERELQKARIRLQTASKDKDSGIRNIHTWLMGPNKMPSLFFFNTCQRHIWEIQRWKWDENGRAEKKNDDFMENLYRYTLTGNKYRPLTTVVPKAVNYACA